MVLLIDDNIILDVLADRQPYADDSDAIWKLCETGIVEGVICAHTIANIMYIMRKKWDPEMRMEVLIQLRKIFEITDTQKSDMIRAAQYRWKDFEDAVRGAVAVRIRADYIITRNEGDYADSPVPALTPEQFLQLKFQS